MTTLVETKRARPVVERAGAVAPTRTPGGNIHRQRANPRAFAGIRKKRREKLLCIRRQLIANTYNVEEHLDAALDKVLRELALD